MADLTLTAYCIADCTGAGTTDAAYEIKTTSTGVDRRYFADFRQITLELDTSVNYFAIRVNDANAYRYTPGDTLATAAVTNAQDMYNKVILIVT